jgi:hypothetical protein
MSLTFATCFEKYRSLLAEVDAVFARVLQAFPEAVTAPRGAATAATPCST